MQETWVQSLGREDPLEEEMATHSSILAWRIPGTEEPLVHGGATVCGVSKVGLDLATKPAPPIKGSPEGSNLCSSRLSNEHQAPEAPPGVGSFIS